MLMKVPNIAPLLVLAWGEYFGCMSANIDTNRPTWAGGLVFGLPANGLYIQIFPNSLC